MPQKFVPFKLFDYYSWLLSSIGAYGPERMHYSLLLNALHLTEFRWYLDWDASRAKDGKRLREVFMDERLIPDVFYEDNPCSVLEALVALNNGAQYVMTIGDKHESKWFWEFLNNLGLLRYTDEEFDLSAVMRVIDTWLDRRFRYSGAGSPFPLKHAHRDQRKVDMWHQMLGYLSENY